MTVACPHGSFACSACRAPGTEPPPADTTYRRMYDAGVQQGMADCSDRHPLMRRTWRVEEQRRHEALSEIVRANGRREGQRQGALWALGGWALVWCVVWWCRGRWIG